ncbi:MAG: hypothetical protein Q4F57_00285 [Weeksellaceae bacterium]|nr:hypothetical protein [Weeksellaceae bacterium]
MNYYNKQNFASQIRAFNFPNSNMRVACIVILLFCCTLSLAQEFPTYYNKSTQVGIIKGLLDQGNGISVSAHFAIRPSKVLQPEIALSYESQKGKTFLTSYNYSAAGISLTPGLRINIRPQRNWNPSILFMLGISYSQQKKDRIDVSGEAGISPALNLGVASTFHQRHMGSIGIFGNDNIGGLYLKYGYWL